MDLALFVRIWFCAHVEGFGTLGRLSYDSDSDSDSNANILAAMRNGAETRRRLRAGRKRSTFLEAVVPKEIG